jgi:hypothetical protein
MKLCKIQKLNFVWHCENNATLVDLQRWQSFSRLRSPKALFYYIFTLMTACHIWLAAMEKFANFELSIFDLEKHKYGSCSKVYRCQQTAVP